ncbi:MAG: BrnA antitoxin family protein [Methylococcales bacterium]|nr:BrnA antitoxin family protein [Methylococcales bacterium]
MPALKPNTLLPSDEENARITAAALSDPDAIPLTDTEWEQVKPLVRVGSQPNKQRIAISFDSEIIDYFRTQGNDWQTRMNDALKEWLKEHAV